MIIRFTVDNVLSFNSEQELLLIPGKNRNHSDHVIKKNKSRDVDILKSAIIYGANASGKTNLIKAIYLMKQILLHGERDTILYDKFKLDGLAGDRPSKVEMEFNINEINYAYGFTFTHNQIETEWLYYFNKEKDFKIFDRKTTGKQVEVTFDNLKLKKKEMDNLAFMGRITKPAECFLHSLISSNVDDMEGINMLKDAYSWFTDSLTIIFPNSRFGGLEVGLDTDKSFADLFQWALEYFGTSIKGLEQTDVDFFSSDVDLPKFIKEEIQSSSKVGEKGLFTGMDNLRYKFEKMPNGDISASKLMTKHTTQNMNDAFVNFEMNDESDGTQRIMDFIPAIAELTKHNRVFIIDEIERSLHVNLVVKIMTMFYEFTVGKRSQLIVTTHESALLDQDLVRKDEVWFVDKNKNGESEIRSLAEYNVRKDLDIRSGYLHGRFGAIPKFYNTTPNPLINIAADEG
ncbi:MAG: AAA15 family ATPase/GTPase [Halioglobus sp.]|jgi:AAA15 family ATPase/GTPase